ncbi:hypothetical protein D9756_009891 [Leucocoprinus leucothites]|uniref:F-box domain-containing protein n=1 Tax=Leucocoprinus leucothites TaxID=201217 RepID=A0A8H5CTF4_9AGAR|nr:hypothetical protein D9756_009891 [Leucoagaricus leucothites]
MLARLTATRRLPQILSVRYSSGIRDQGSVAHSKEFSKKEKAHEDQFVRQHEQEQIRKLREKINKKQAELVVRPGSTLAGHRGSEAKDISSIPMAVPPKFLCYRPLRDARGPEHLPSDLWIFSAPELRSRQTQTKRVRSARLTSATTYYLSTTLEESELPNVRRQKGVMSDAANDLPIDILILIFQVLQDDYSSLLRGALVNRAFNCAASKFLYRRVVLAPHFRIALSLRETPSIPSTSNLISACLPKYAPFVEILEITGYLPSRASPNDTLSKTILNATATFQNIRVAIFTPTTFLPDTLLPILSYLAQPSSIQTSFEEQLSEKPSRQITEHDTQSPNLRELVVNTSCTDGNNAPILTQITGLSELSIHSPTRAILDLLPDWLRRLSDSLIELHLKVRFVS